MNSKNKKMMPVAIILGVFIIVLFGGTVFLAVSGRVSAKSSLGKIAKEKNEQSEEEEVKRFSVEGKSIPDGTVVQAADADAGNVETDEEGYILPNSHMTELTETDLENLTAQELTYARNEIYARHGRVFESQELNDYFNSKDWYEVDEGFQDSSLSSVEAKNAEFISAYQNDNALTYSPQ